MDHLVLKKLFLSLVFLIFSMECQHSYAAEEDPYSRLKRPLASSASTSTLWENPNNPTYSEPPKRYNVRLSVESVMTRPLEQDYNLVVFIDDQQMPIARFTSSSLIPNERIRLEGMSPNDRVSFFLKHDQTNVSFKFALEYDTFVSDPRVCKSIKADRSQDNTFLLYDQETGGRLYETLSKQVLNLADKDGLPLEAVRFLLDKEISGQPLTNLSDLNLSILATKYGKESKPTLANVAQSSPRISRKNFPQGILKKEPRVGDDSES